MRKLFYFLLLPTASLFCLLSSTAAEQSNVLFVCVDDLKPSLGCYGDSVAHTPNFDRLAAQGLTFTNAHCSQAVCGPSRASTFTSLRPDRTGVHDLHTPWLEACPDLTTLPEHLRAHGFATAGAGKLLHAGKSEKELSRRSWDRYVDFDELPFHKKHGKPVGKFYHSAEAHAICDQLTEPTASSEAKALTEAGERLPFEALDFPDDAYADGAIRKQAIRFLDRFGEGEKPFFIGVGFSRPHLPFVAPQRYWDIYEGKDLPAARLDVLPEGAPAFAGHSWGELRNYSTVPAEGALAPDLAAKLVHGYYASVSYIDAQLGYLLDALDELSLTDKTIIVLWSDHGWHLGDHGIWCKHSNFEQATRSVLMIAAPGIDGGKENGSPVELTDIFPTICALTGTPMPSDRDGLSLAPILDGSAESIRRYALSQYGRNHIPTMGYTLRTESHRYTAWLENEDFKSALTHFDEDHLRAEELYDYNNDPLEKVSLHANPEQKELLSEFREMLTDHLKTQATKSLQPRSK